MIDGQVERQDKGEIKSETKRKEQQMTGQMQRRIDQEGLGLVPARTKAPGLEVKCYGLSM